MYNKLCLCTMVVAVTLMAGCNKEVSKAMETGPKKVSLETSMGAIVIELNEEAAPVTVKNFLTYVEEGFLDGVIFHRVMPNFMIQGGGFTADLQKKEVHAPIVNEASNGLKNDRGTIAMGQIPGNPDSATSQFFINLKNNSFLDYVAGGSPGYTVFGKVVEGMDVVDKIAVVKTKRVPMSEALPLEPVVIESAKVVSDN